MSFAQSTQSTLSATTVQGECTPIVFVGIIGGSGMGKTTLATRLHQLTGAPIITLDDFYKPLPRGCDGADYNWDSVDAFDWDILRQVMHALRSGRPAFVPHHDHATYARTEQMREVHPAPVVIFEGIFLFAKEDLAREFDIKVFVHCDLDSALARRIRRDVERGFALSLVLSRYLAHVKPAYEQHIAPWYGRVDVVVKNVDNTLVGEELLCSTLMRNIDGDDIKTVCARTESSIDMRNGTRNVDTNSCTASNTTAICAEVRAPATSPRGHVQ